MSAVILLDWWASHPLYVVLSCTGFEWLKLFNGKYIVVLIKSSMQGGLEKWLRGSDH